MRELHLSFLSDTGSADQPAQLLDGRAEHSSCVTVNLDESGDSLMNALTTAMGNEKAQSHVEHIITRARLKREACSPAL